jgi:hypothetical protein
VCTHPNGDAAPQALFEITFTEGRFNKRILAGHLTGGIGPGRRLVKAGALGTGAILAVDFTPVPNVSPAAYVNAVVRLIGETTSDFAEAAILTALWAAVEAALQAIVEITFTECRFNKRMLAGSLTSRARGATVEAARGLDCAALSHSRLAALVDSGTLARAPLRATENNNWSSASLAATAGRRE